jgi:hypothetical protein
MAGEKAVAVQQSKVVMTGTLQDGKEIIQEVPMNHAPGTPDPALMSQALTMVRSSGGLMTEGEGGTIYFYPMLTLKSIHLQVNRVSLVLV